MSEERQNERTRSRGDEPAQREARLSEKLARLQQEAEKRGDHVLAAKYSRLHMPIAGLRSALEEFKDDELDGLDTEVARFITNAKKTI